MKTKFLALVSIVLSTVLFACGNNAPIQPPVGANGLNNGWNQNGWNQGGWNQGGWNQGGWNQGGWNQGGWNQGGWNQGGWNQGGGLQCLPLYSYQCGSGYVFNPYYGSCIPYYHTMGANINIQIGVNNGAFNNPCYQMCGPGSISVQGFCYR